MRIPDRLINFVLLAIAIGGMAVAGYLTSVHYASVPLACSGDGVIDCQRVLSSRYSEVMGIPWSVGGIAWFGISGLLAIAALMRWSEAVSVHLAQTAWSLLGMVVVFYLVGVELIAVKHICIWCTSMHALIVVTLLLVLFRQPAEEDREAE